MKCSYPYQSIFIEYADRDKMIFQRNTLLYPNSFTRNVHIDQRFCEMGVNMTNNYGVQFIVKLGMLIRIWPVIGVNTNYQPIFGPFQYKTGTLSKKCIGFLLSEIIKFEIGEIDKIMQNRQCFRNFPVHKLTILSSSFNAWPSYLICF